MKKDNHYFGWGLTAVCVVCAVMLIYDLVFRDSIVMIYTRKLMEILAPILYGMAIAYLLAPIVNWFERVILPRAGSRAGAKGVRAVSMVLTWVVVFALFYGLLSVLLPELYKSIRQLVGNLTTYYGTIEAWMLRLLENNPDLARRAQELFNQYYQQAFAWLRDNLAPQLQVAVQAVTGGVVGVLVFFKNLFLGIMVSLYLLGSKEHFAAAGCKLCYTFLPEDRAAWFIRADRHLAGFVLVNRHPDCGRPLDWAVAEFFVAYPFRRRGVGSAAMAEIFRRFKGNWQIKYHPRNETSAAFWH